MQKNYKGLLNRFSKNIETTRDFIVLVDPLIDQHGKKQIADNIEGFAPILIIYEKMLRGQGYQVDRGVLKAAKKIGKIKISGDEGELTFKSQAALKNFIQANEKFELIAGRSKYLYEVSLISLISSVEWFLSQILHSHFKGYPKLVTAVSQKNFTYSDIEKFNTLDDAKQFLIDQKVDEIIRSDFRSWIDYLKLTLKLDLSFCEKDLSDAEEVFLRRNLLVHNGGVVNNIYLNKVSPDLLQKFKLKKGAQVLIDDKYLQSSINLLESLFLCMGALMWRKQLKDAAQISEYFLTLNLLTFNHMKEGRYEVSEKISCFLEADKDISIHDKLMTTVNRWISIKQQGRFNEIEAEILSSDFSAFEDKYVMGRYVLLGKFSEAVEILKVMLKAKKISVDELRDWPLFNDIRDDPGFSSLIKESDSVEVPKKSPKLKKKATSLNAGKKKIANPKKIDRRAPVSKVRRSVKK